VVNDNSYRVLYFRQRIQKGGRLIGTLLTNPDFKALAESFNIPGRAVDNNGDIDDAIVEMLEADSPYVLELRIHPDDIPPLNLDASLKMTSL
jgi:acetolactate synthase-1/2/3 large subunit